MKAVRERLLTSQTGNVDAGDGANGFLLLDMALALALLLLLMAVVWPYLGGTTRAQHSATALDIATLLRSDRSRAARDGVLQGTRIDLIRRTVTDAGGRRVTIPGDVGFEISTGTSCSKGERLFVIVFTPQGTSCGGNIRLKKGHVSYVIRINWLSGIIDVVSTSES